MKTDCRTKTGLTVGLIDSLISIARAAAPGLREIRDDRKWPNAVVEALRDLYEDEDVLYVFTFLDSESPYVDNKDLREYVRKTAEMLREQQTLITI